MIEYLLSLSLLIVVVLLIRGIFRKTVSPRAIYALWLVVVIRMFLPITLFEVDVTLPEFMQAQQIEQEEQSGQLPEDSEISADVQEQSPVSTPMQTAPTIPSQSTSPTTPEYPTVITPITPTTPVTPTVPADTTPVTPDSQETIPDEVITPDETVSEVPEEPVSVNWKRIADLVWFCGAMIASVWVLLTSLTYSRRLKKDRVFHRTVRGTKVYVSEYAGVPCIAGLIPSIYITPEAANSKSEILIIIHEHVHIRHGDHIWSIIRALALIVFWWNPLVWLAATVSKQDAELACDDAISSRMNDDGRLKYANILIDTIPQKHRYAVGLGSAPMKERILMLTKKQKNRWLSLILAIVLAVSAVGCSFVSLNEKPGEDSSNDKIGIITENLADFLTEEQITLYEKAGVIYPLFNGVSDNINILHLLLEGASFEEQETYRATYNTGDEGVYRIDGFTYLPSYGVYDTFDEFKALCVSVFTEEYFEELNQLITYSGSSIFAFTDYNNHLYYIAAARGGAFGYAPDEFPDEYELVEMSDEAIVFSVTGHYKSSNVDPDFTLTEETFTIKMVLTENGWRFAKFADAMLDEEVYSWDSEETQVVLTEIPITDDRLGQNSIMEYVHGYKITQNGKYIISRYNACYPNSIPITEMWRYGILDRNGNEVVPCDNMEIIEDVHGTIYIVGSKDDYTGTEFVFISEEEVKNIQAIEDSSMYYISGKYPNLGYGDSNGNPLTDTVYSYCSPVNENGEAIVVKDRKTYMITLPTDRPKLPPYSTPGFASISEEFGHEEISKLVFTPYDSADIVLYHRFMNSNTYIFLCAVREVYAAGTLSNSAPKEFAAYYTADFGKTIGTVDIQLPEDLEYDTVMPVAFGPGGGSMELQIILRLTKGEEEFYVAFDNFTYSGNGYLGFEYRGQISEDTVQSFAIRQTLPHQAIMENQSVLYDTLTGKEMLLTDWLKNDGYAVSKYTVIDLDKDAHSETVLWLTRGSDEYAGFLILHSNGGKTNAHLLYYRQFSNLKEDGTFDFSGGVANGGFGKISFNGDSYTIQKLAYRESTDNQNVFYFVEGKSVSRDVFDAFVNEQDQKSDAMWYEWSAGQEDQSTPTVDLGGIAGEWWYHSFRHEHWYAFYGLNFRNQTAEMQFDHGLYESEYDNRYSGTYTVDPATQEITAVLHDNSNMHIDPNITLRFTIEVQTDQNDKTLVLHILSCDVPKYQHLVGQSLAFTRQFGYADLQYQDAQDYYQMWYDHQLTAEELLGKGAVITNIVEKIKTTTGIDLYATHFIYEYHSEEDRFPFRFLITDETGTKIIEANIIRYKDEKDGIEKYAVEVNPVVITVE